VLEESFKTLVKLWDQEANKARNQGYHA
jgi:hypothetical protein